MKYRRLEGQIVEVKDGDSNGIVPTVRTPLLGVLQDNPPDHSDPLKRGLPFQPRSYRDFMLFENHYSASLAGFTQIHRPVISWIAAAYTGITGWRYPGFKPGTLWSQQPIFYQSNHLAFYADEAPIQLPKYCTYLDLELELGVLLGGHLFNATAEQAKSAIAGFCVFNDFSVRNVQVAEMNSGFGPQHSKCFANSISSTVVSADEIMPRIERLTGRVIINGQVVQQCNTDRWQFTVAEAIAHVSKSTRLYPGEFFGTGTFPLGAGIEHARFKLRVGDVVRLEIDGIGSVTNKIVADE
ncbi:fumarylacetoacetate [Trichoderma sp. SZMC 28013]